MRYLFTCDESVAEPIEAVESSLRLSLSLTFHSYLFARPIGTLAPARTVTLAQVTKLADEGFDDVKEIRSVYIRMKVELYLIDFNNFPKFL